MTQTINLPYFENSADLFSQLADREWSIFLDSGFPSESAGRYDILASEPIATIISDAKTSIVSSGSSDKQYSSTSPFDVLRSIIKHYTPDNNNGDSYLPFQGGALGYLSYDLARTIEKLPNLADDNEQLPDMAIGIYTWAVIVDHKQKKSYLTGEVKRKNPHWSWQQLIKIFSQPPAMFQADNNKFIVTSAVKSNFDYAQYRSAFKRIKRYILAGDCYQINLTQRFSASANGNPWDAYQQLRKLNPAPFSAYINTPFGQILSSSPERFLQVERNKVEAKPIKGTRPRSDDPMRDKQQITSLQASLKDRAENIMIVDLLRNDISRVCKIGSVSVPRLFEVENYTTVHHLVSTIQATLANNKDTIDLLKACFPGGSITGAPKIRAMEIIEELEPDRRGIYCGSIGYIDFNGNMDTNIAIRTLVYNQNIIRFWVGGGIVHDSELDAEYQETFDKGKPLLELLDNLTNKPLKQ
ncbi:MAG TPA: aminodeoxychorismate synthase component I [Leucothrix mucor]|uniref:aminodeoxychorismate synthase n=1 Tax=Leucothrix mucor TaxID=45248 RepID=A0A7V2SZZ3_LEUMU|nr:aminodeoxychorismate synthase component I [Leucothrix mucor]